MDLSRILTISFFACLFLIVFIMVLIRLINKYIIFQHYVIIKVENGKTIKDLEHFTALVNDAKDVPIPNQTVTDKCNCMGLNKLHERGKEQNKPYATLCKNKPDGDEMNNYYRKTIKAPIASSTDRLPAMHNSQTDEDEPVIKGANYMIYNANPNPYHLDFALYDPKEPAVTPVGVNYIEDS